MLLSIDKSNLQSQTRANGTLISLPLTKSEYVRTSCSLPNPYRRGVWEVVSHRLGFLCASPPLYLPHTQTHTHLRSRLRLLMTSLSCGAPSGSRPRKGGGTGADALMSDLIRPDNQVPFGSPVTTVTPNITFCVVGRQGQSGLLFLTSIFNGRCT